jgi:hypothetical protein
VVAAIATLVLVACSSSSSPSSGNGTDAGAGGGTDGGGAKGSPGNVTFMGTLDGKAFNATDAVSVVSTSGGTTDTVIAISDFANECAVVSANGSKANSTLVRIFFRGVAVTPGTYMIPGQTNGFDLDWELLDATCGSPGGASADTATVTITRADASGIAGTFKATFAPEGPISGTFDAPNCAANLSGEGGTCM